MGAAERELFELLKQYDFELIRGKKHKVYKNRQGKTLVLASTPSDGGWAENALHNLKNCLGIGAQGREAVDRRRVGRNRCRKTTSPACNQRRRSSQCVKGRHGWHWKSCHQNRARLRLVVFRSASETNLAIQLFAGRTTLERGGSEYGETA